MRQPLSFFAATIMGGLFLFSTLFNIPSLQTSPDAVSTQAAALATTAAAQATIAAQISQGITLTAGTGNAVSAAIISPSISVASSSASSSGYQPPEITLGGSQLIFVDPNIQTEPGEPGFKETFEPAPQPGWIFDDERWTILNGGLTFSHVGTQNAEEVAYLPVLVSGNYEIEMDISYPNTQRGRIYARSYFWLDIGEVRGGHPYFNGTEYEEIPTGVLVHIRQDLDSLDKSDSRDTLISLNKREGEIPNEENTEYGSSRVEYNNLFPGTHRVKFSVVDNKMSVEMDKTKVTEYVDLNYRPNNDPKALYIEWGFWLTNESGIKDLLFPVIDNITVRLLE